MHRAGVPDLQPSFIPSRCCSSSPLHPKLTAHSGCARQRYRSAFGHTWDGKGDMPQWLRQATSAGQSLAHFAVEKSSTSSSRGRPAIDWSRDPFAGMRLATVRPS
ncbi:H-NS family nucleoid-associated regulatory protein [Paraburkholderia sediminicola]|uniref:H-NS family nucleoid-associated regulatory protein n=1 Tax=Paraburkholderia sediminicola TaxID=458836 RepID=UPI0038B74979